MGLMLCTMCFCVLLIYYWFVQIQTVKNTPLIISIYWVRLPSIINMFECTHAINKNTIQFFVNVIMRRLELRVFLWNLNDQQVHYDNAVML